MWRCPGCGLPTDAEGSRCAWCSSASSDRRQLPWYVRHGPELAISLGVLVSLAGVCVASAGWPDVGLPVMLLGLPGMALIAGLIAVAIALVRQRRKVTEQPAPPVTRAYSEAI